jgi:anti-sigma factor RsiW
MSDAGALTCRQLVELVTDYLENRLSPAARARFEQHLAACDGCSAYVEQMRLTLRALGRLPEERLSGGAREAMLTAFRDWHAARGGA